MTSAARVVIVGASIGGLTAAETLRAEGFDGEIVLVGDEHHLPYTRPPLSKQILKGEWLPDQATIRTGAELDDLGIHVLTGRSATGLDVDARILHTDAGPLAYDELIIATGTEPRTHLELPVAPSLRTMDDALHLRDRLDAARRVAVVGSGILGSEIAAAARAHGSATLLVGRSGTLSFGGVGTLLTDELAALHTDNGVELALRTEIVGACSASGDRTELSFDDGALRTFDLVVAMIGGSPRTRWLASSSLDISDGVACDARGAAAPGIWAVGDVAAWENPATGRHVRVEHQSHAIEQAVAVATRIARGGESPRPVPLFWSEIHGARIHAYGWFDPRTPLIDITADEGARGVVYGSTDAGGDVHGVVGWNASPREFRAARARVVAAPTPVTANT